MFIDNLKNGKTIYSEYYMAFLERSKEAIVYKRPQICFFFHQNSTPCHKLIYFPDLAPSDFFLYTNLRYSANEEVNADWSYFEVLDKSFSTKGIQMLERRWNDCVTLQVQLSWWIKSHFAKKLLYHTNLLNELIISIFEKLFFEKSIPFTFVWELTIKKIHEKCVDYWN